MPLAKLNQDDVALIGRALRALAAVGAGATVAAEATFALLVFLGNLYAPVLFIGSVL